MGRLNAIYCRAPSASSSHLKQLSISMVSSRAVSRHSASYSQDHMIPYTPFAPPLPSPNKQGSGLKHSYSRHLSPGGTSLSRRATRIITPSGRKNSYAYITESPPPQYTDVVFDGQRSEWLASDRDLPEEERRYLQGAYDWFVESFPQGKLGAVRRDHPLDLTVCPYFMGFGHASMDWDALITFHLLAQQESSGVSFFAPDGPTPVPRRVLDLGCGSCPHWCLQAVKQKGWESTQFVGLDIAPIMVTNGMLEFEHANRLSWIQHNFLDRSLPFEADRFNYIRVSGVGLGMPEHKWQDLIEEVVRIAAPAAVIEVVECDFKFIVPAIHDSPSWLPNEALQTLREAIDIAFAKRFLNLSTLSPIRPALVMYCDKTVEKTYPIVLPSSPISDFNDREEVVGRVLLRAYAERLEGASGNLASDLAIARIAARNQSSENSEEEPGPRQTRVPSLALSDGQGSSLDPRMRLKTRPQVEREIRDIFAEWSEDLIERAGVARLLEEKWGWECTFDKELEEVLEVYLPVFSVRLREYDLMDQQIRKDGDVDGDGGDAFRAQLDPEVEFRRNQVNLAKREGDNELRMAKNRLGRGAHISYPPERGPLDTLNLHSWVARK